VEPARPTDYARDHREYTFRTMRTATLALGLLYLPDAAAAPPTRDLPIDVPPAVLEKMVVLKSGPRRLYAVPDARIQVKVPEGIVRSDFLFVSEDGKTFRRMRPERGGLIGAESYYYFLWDPRVEREDQVGLYVDKDKKPAAAAYCGDKEAPLARLADAEARALLAAARFVEGPFGRQEYALARDDRGVYYYVDRGLGLTQDFRLFVGPRGALKLQKMKNVVRDSAGDVFASKTGTLRLILPREPSKQEGSWVKGKKRVPLVVLPLRENEGLIYGDLGVYVGVPYGSPCDQI